MITAMTVHQVRTNSVARAVLVACWLSNVCLVAESQEKNPERRHRDGPLVAEDFRGSPPKLSANGEQRQPNFNAWLETDTRWTNHYRYDQKEKSYEVRLTDIDVFTVVLPDKSFNTRPADRNLLDHEQGHFDIAESFALETRIKFLEQIRQGRPIIVTGASKEAAIEKLRSEIQQQVEANKSLLRIRQQAYDDVTSHGKLALEQKRQREEQLARLKLLQEKCRLLLPEKGK